MKKALSIVGSICLSMIMLGGLFKAQHWPGAGPLLVFGLSLFASVFVFLFLGYRISTKHNVVDILEGSAISLVMSLLSIGILFKIQHWPGANAMIAAGQMVSVFLALPVLIYNFVTSKDDNKSIKILWVAIVIAGFTLAYSQNFSKNFLNSFLVNNDLVVKSNKELIHIASDPEGLDSLKIAQIKEIQEESNKMLNLINDYKLYLIWQVEKISEDNSMRDTMTIEFVRAKDNYDVPTHILIGEPSFPNSGTYSALALKEALFVYKSHLNNMVTSDGARSRINDLLNTDNRKHHGNPVTWEIDLFYHQPIVSVINTLSLLQNNVLTAQLVSINEIVDREN